MPLRTNVGISRLQRRLLLGFCLAIGCGQAPHRVGDAPCEGPATW